MSNQQQVTYEVFLLTISLAFILILFKTHVSRYVPKQCGFSYIREFHQNPHSPALLLWQPRTANRRTSIALVKISLSCLLILLLLNKEILTIDHGLPVQLTIKFYLHAGS